MRKVLIASAASLALAVVMAVPAGASVNVAAPVRGGTSGDGGHAGGGGGHSGGKGGHAGGGGDRRSGGDQFHGRGSSDGRDRSGHFDHDGQDHDRYGHDYDYYDGPYDDGPYYDGPHYDGACPDGGYYDANGTYWYWDPGADSYVACPD